MVNNDEVLEKIKEQRNMIKIITQRQLWFLGHIVREYGLETIVLEGKMDGWRSRGRQVAAGGMGAMLPKRKNRDEFAPPTGLLTWRLKPRFSKEDTKVIDQDSPSLHIK